MLWFVAAVSAMAVAFLRLTTGDRHLASAQVDAVRARALAEDGLARTMLFVNGRSDRPAPRSLSWTLAEGRVTATIASESGKVDLNGADSSLIDALARAVGIPAAKADAIGDAVVDWRDPDELRLPHGAEKRDYDLADRAHGPANAPFRQVEELRYVLGVDNQAYARMAPFLTVYSGRASPDRRQAAATVRAALDLERGLKPPEQAGAGGTGAAAPAGAGTSAAVGGSRGISLTAGESQPSGPTSTPQPAAATGEGAAVPSSTGSVYTVDLDVRLAEGYEAHARAVVALSGETGGSALRILDWASALPAPAEQ